MNADTAKIHRVCCWTFHGSDPSVPGTYEYTVDHRDGNRRNNSADITFTGQRGSSNGPILVLNDLKRVSPES